MENQSSRHGLLVEHLPAELWEAKVPGVPRRNIRMLAGHLHNARCMWIKTLGKEHGIAVPRNVDRNKVQPKDLVSALERSSTGISSLLRLGCDQGGNVPVSSSYVWRNLPSTSATSSALSSHTKAITVDRS